MTAVAFALAVTLAAALGIIVWLVHGRVQDAANDGDIRVAQVSTEAEAERLAFQLDVTEKALVAANKRAEALEGIIADELNDPPNADLPAADWRGRLLRLAQSWRGAADARSPLRADTGEGVSQPTSAEEAGPVVSTRERG